MGILFRYTDINVYIIIWTNAVCMYFKVLNNDLDLHNLQTEVFVIR